eukprot:SAG31_NODE_959_length_10757_cov_2.260086_6_plen_87_part_00
MRCSTKVTYRQVLAAAASRPACWELDGSIERALCLPDAMTRRVTGGRLLCATESTDAAPRRERAAAPMPGRLLAGFSRRRVRLNWY